MNLKGRISVNFNICVTSGRAFHLTVCVARRTHRQRVRCAGSHMSAGKAPHGRRLRTIIFFDTVVGRWSCRVPPRRRLIGCPAFLGGRSSRYQFPIFSSGKYFTSVISPGKARTLFLKPRLIFSFYPDEEVPEWLGLPRDADFVLQSQEAEVILQDLMSLQRRSWRCIDAAEHMQIMS